MNAEAKRLTDENARLCRQVEELSADLTRALTRNVSDFRVVRERESSLHQLAANLESLEHHRNELENRFKALGECVDESISIVDLNMRYLYLNARAANLHRTTIEKALGKTVGELAEPAIASIFITEFFTPVLQTGKEVRKQQSFNRDNHFVVLDMTSSPVFDQSGHMISVLNITRDITHEQTRNQYDHIEQSINVLSSFSGGIEPVLLEIFVRLTALEWVDLGGIYRLDSERETLSLISHFNLPPDFLRIVSSYTHESDQYRIVSGGKPVYLTARDVEGANRKRMKLGGFKSLAILPLIHDGQTIGSLNLASRDEKLMNDQDRLFIENIAWRLARLIVLFEAEDELKRSGMELEQTIRQLKEHEQQLIQKAKMESLGELAAGMANEISRPLVVISLATENMIQRLASGNAGLPDSYLRVKCESVLNNMARIRQVIDNMRSFARNQADSTFDKVSMAMVGGNVCTMVQGPFRREGIKVMINLPEDPLWVMGNRNKLEQVLLNLLSNSRRALLEKAASVTGEAFIPVVRMDLTSGDGRIMITVTDNGTGISEEHLPKLFTSFFTTRHDGEGTGIGLATAFGIIVEMNGEIRAESEYGSFTRFIISLPGV